MEALTGEKVFLMNDKHVSKKSSKKVNTFTGKSNKPTNVGAICGGQHQSKEWDDADVIDHEVCVDCYCGIPFRRKL